MDQNSANWDHGLEHAAISDLGLRRPNNQDAVAVVIADSRQTWQKRGHLFVVADGMGAHAAGELASKLATDTVALTYCKLLSLSPAEAILAATREANAQIHQRGQASYDFKGMGTTSTSLLLLPQGALLAHVGDSRAYRLRGDRFEQLTFDHSLLWELRAVSQASEDAITDHIPKNIITRSLGPNPTVQVDLEGPFPLSVGDTFLLCTDGLSGQVGDEEMGAILASLPPDEAVHAMVNLANLRGGPDNITAIVVRLSGGELAQTDGSEADTAPARAAARPVHPLLWTLLGVLGLAAAGSAAMERWLAALICLGGAVLAGVVGLVQRYGGEQPGFHFAGRPLGRGPYKSCKCGADGRFVEGLAGIVQELREAATQENWTVDWNRFNAFLDQAAAARQDAQYAQAVREYFHAISFMMEQLRRQRRAADGEENDQ